MTVRRVFSDRSDPCCVCGAPVPARSVTTDDPEAPELIQLAPRAWFGIVEDQPGGAARLIVCCSHACLGELLREEP